VSNGLQTETLQPTKNFIQSTDFISSCLIVIQITTQHFWWLKWD